MGFGGADRYIINDRKLNKIDNTAFAINLTRNEGVGKIEL